MVHKAEQHSLRPFCTDKPNIRHSERENISRIELWRPTQLVGPSKAKHRRSITAAIHCAVSMYGWLTNFGHSL